MPRTKGVDVAGFAVLDFETTGFDANQHDRVVEVGVVLLSSDGDIQDEWSTLLNPGRDVGRTDIHGIGAGDVLGAPTFAEIVPKLLRDLRGRIVVCHNIAFDLRFLGAELRRAGVPLDNEWLTGLCLPMLRVISIAYSFYPNDAGAGEWIRKRDGYWREGPPRRGSRVSAVLCGENIRYWDIASKMPTMFLNPWASMRLTQTDAFATVHAMDSGVLVSTEGELPATALLEIPDNWPWIDG